MKKPALLIFLLLIALSQRAFCQNPSYKIQPTDVLSVTVHQHPDLATKTRVSSEGFISFPLLGKVEVKDLTVQDTELKLKNLLEKDYLVNAQVIVFIEEYHPRQVSVTGEVEKPGKYDMPEERDLTVMEAIALAGGFTKDAAVNATKIMRGHKDEKEIITVKITDITHKGLKDKDIALKPEDIVYVPESFF